MAFGDHVLVKLGLDTKTFNKGLTSAQEKAKKFGASFQTAFVGALGTAVIANASKQIINFGASIGDMSDRLGVSAEFLQALQYGAEQSGVSAKGATIALQRFARRSAEAGAVGGSLKKTLDDLGVSLKNNNGTTKTSEQLFTEFGEALAEMENPAEKLRVAFKFLDTEGVALVQMFAKGKPSLKEFGEEAKSLGLMISNEKVKALQDASGELEKLGRQFKVFGANVLPPLFKKFKEIVNYLQQLYVKFMPVTDVVIQAGKAIASYWIAGKVTAGLTAVIGGFLYLAKAIRGASVAMIGFNTATKANPLGLIVAGITLAMPVIEGFIARADEATEKLRKLSQQKVDALKNELEGLGDLMRINAKETADFNKELMDLIKADTAPIKTQVEALKDKQALLKDNLAKHGEIYNAELKTLRLLKDELNTLQRRRVKMGENFDLQEQIAQKQKEVAESEESLSFTRREQAKLSLELYKNNKLVVEAEKEAKDLAFLRQKGLERLLDDSQKELINLERKNARVKAINEGGAKAVEILDRQFKIEDKIVALYKTGKMTARQAFDLANKLADATDEEKRLLEQANKLEADALKLNEEQRKEAEKKLEALKKQQELQQKNQALVDQELAVLRLKARGQNDLADLLQARIDNERILVDIQQRQGLALGKAVAQRKEELALQAKIKANKIAEARADILRNAVGEQAGRKLGDAVDREDRKRIRAGKEIIRQNEAIARARKRGGAGDAKLIKELTARRDKNLALVLDDKAKKQIADLEKQKIDLKKDFDNQQRAIALAEKKLKQQELDQKADIAKAKQGVIDEGLKQEQKLKAILDARNKALEVMMQTLRKDIKNIPPPNININNNGNKANLVLPKNSEPMKVVVTNGLKEATQQSILRTLNGFFINQ